MTTAKKVVVTIEFKGTDAELVDTLSRGVDLGLLLRDALGEFDQVRSKDDYIATRYAHTDERFRKVKVADVTKRCHMARVLRRGDVTIEVSSEASSSASPSFDSQEASSNPGPRIMCGVVAGRHTHPRCPYAQEDIREPNPWSGEHEIKEDLGP